MKPKINLPRVYWGKFSPGKSIFPQAKVRSVTSTNIVISKKLYNAWHWFTISKTNKLQFRSLLFYICWQAYDDRRAILIVLFNPSNQSQFQGNILRYMALHILTLTSFVRKLLNMYSRPLYSRKQKQKSEIFVLYLMLLNCLWLTSVVQTVQEENKGSFYFWPAESTSKDGKRGMRTYYLSEMPPCLLPNLK